MPWQNLTGKVWGALFLSWRTGFFQRSIKASKSIINSKIQTEGELLAFNSTVIGSELIAFKGMTIKDSLNGKIKGKIAQFVVKKTLYNVKFKEVMDPKTKTVSIAIETY